MRLLRFRALKRSLSAEIPHSLLAYGIMHFHQSCFLLITARVTVNTQIIIASPTSSSLERSDLVLLSLPTRLHRQNSLLFRYQRNLLSLNSFILDSIVTTVPSYTTPPIPSSYPARHPTTQPQDLLAIRVDTRKISMILKLWVSTHTRACESRVKSIWNNDADDVDEHPNCRETTIS